jgi:magnesium chelatase family protein
MLERQGKPNAMLESREIEQYCVVDSNGLATLQRAITKFGLSARSYHRTIKVARSIADSGRVRAHRTRTYRRSARLSAPIR